MQASQNHPVLDSPPATSPANAPQVVATETLHRTVIRCAGGHRAVGSSQSLLGPSGCPRAEPTSSARCCQQTADGPPGSSPLGTLAHVAYVALRAGFRPACPNRAFVPELAFTSHSALSRSRTAAQSTRSVQAIVLSRCAPSARWPGHPPSRGPAGATAACPSPRKCPRLGHACGHAIVPRVGWAEPGGGWAFATRHRTPLASATPRRVGRSPALFGAGSRPPRFVFPLPAGVRAATSPALSAAAPHRAVQRGPPPKPPLHKSASRSKRKKRCPLFSGHLYGHSINSGDQEEIVRCRERRGSAGTE